jgi:hypothetical protein
MNPNKTWGRIIKIMGKIKMLGLEVWWWVKRRHFLD